MKIPEPKKKEVTAGCRKLHNEELHTFYSSPNTRVNQKLTAITCGTPRTCQNTLQISSLLLCTQTDVTMIELLENVPNSFRVDTSPVIL
jgi:hypothetical protein